MGLIRKKTRIKDIVIIAALTLVFLLAGAAAAGAQGDFISIDSTRSVGEEITVPVRISLQGQRNGMASGEVTVTAPAEGPFTYQGIQFSSAFDGRSGSLFSTVTNRDGDQLTLSFTSGQNQRVDRLVIGYLTYRVSPGTQRGEGLELEISRAVIRDRDGSQLPVTRFSGRIERNYAPGDTLGYNKATSASASRMLQHAEGKSLITDSDILEAADLNADGSINASDAMLALRKVVGLEESFFTIKTGTSLPEVLRDVKYSHQLEAVFGSPPYTWARVTGSLPSGLALDPATGIISGTYTRSSLSQFNYTVRVTDRYGHAAQRQFTLVTGESNIQKVTRPPSVTLQAGGTPEMPSRVEVTYRDNTPGVEPVTWDAFDTSKPGTLEVTGRVGDCGLPVKITVVIIDELTIEEVRFNYLQLLDIYTLEVKVASQVFSVKANRKNMHYEGDNWFSLATTTLKKGSTVKIETYDRYGNLLESKQAQVNVGQR